MDDHGPGPGANNTCALILQCSIRTPWLDTYFVYTSALGTHTFFTTFLPALFFFGYDEVGRGYVVLLPPFFVLLIYAIYCAYRLLVVLALGVYTSSFVKDLICAPRPFAPPVTRLSKQLLQAF